MGKLELNEFGIYLRRLRDKRGEKLKDMATKLNITSSYLNNLETGRRPIPLKFVSKIAQVYFLGSNEVAQLHSAYNCSQNVLKVDITSLASDDRQILFKFVEYLSSNNLSMEDKESLKRMLNL